VGEFELPENLITDNPIFVDNSSEFQDDCGDACKI